MNDTGFHLEAVCGPLGTELARLVPALWVGADALFEGCDGVADATECCVPLAEFGRLAFPWRASAGFSAIFFLLKSRMIRAT